MFMHFIVTLVMMDDCMLGSMGQVQSIDSKAVFVFVGARWFVVPLILPVTDLTLS